MVVQHNMQAANANRMLNLTVNGQQKSTEKLSSGYRINRAADDAAGLAISEKMRSQIRGLDRASTNAQDGISVVQTAEGALNEVHSMLQRMNELATQAANDTNTSQDRKEIQLEVDQLTSEIDRVASTTQFNTMNLLDGSFTGKNLQVGSLSGQTIELSIGSMNAEALGLEGTGTKHIAAQKGIKAAHGYITDLSGDLASSTAKAGDSLKKIFSGDTSELKNGISYKYHKATDTWDPTTDAALGGVKIALKDGVTVDDDTTITIDGQTSKDATTGITYSGGKASLKNTKLVITEDNMAGVSDGTYIYDATSKDWTIDDGSGKKIASGNYTVCDSDGNLATLADGAAITIKGWTDGQAASAAKTVKVNQKLDVTSHDGAEDAMSRVQNAIDKVSSQRATLGAVQNRLEHTIANLDTTSENTQAAESRIRDTDMAKEMVTWSKNNILAQAGQSMLAQANQSNQGVLSLLQ